MSYGCHIFKFARVETGLVDWQCWHLQSWHDLQSWHWQMLINVTEWISGGLRQVPAYIGILQLVATTIPKIVRTLTYLMSVWILTSWTCCVINFMKLTGNTILYFVDGWHRVEKVVISFKFQGESSTHYRSLVSSHIENGNTFSYPYSKYHEHYRPFTLPLIPKKL